VSTAESFRSAVGSRFRVTSAGTPIELELADLTAFPPRDEAEARRRAAAGIRAEPFTLVFRGPRDARLGQGTHRLEHDRLGALEIFLVPIRPDERGPLYEAVFN
jgi:hypothetical protein